ncbi:enoyl-CoA hydratase [Rhodopila sp.]|uniref:enoyl-CoA hydratase n=1 Tax=Rhodopila sp. TaxID=2480087 RepID=UPI002C80D072|nr:enoyl-CoA hydratase [Rhodopila sp.]HVZ06685.1 enoyl-CoA hydratase [Rhodopila sp.]
MSDVIVEQAGPVLEITFNRPEKKNALTRAMYQTVVDAFQRINKDGSIRAGLLTGAGDIFTAGNDIQDFQDRAKTNEAIHASPFLDALSTLAKPLVGAVNGAAIGVGTTMLAHCDIVIAARSARFIMPFTSLGLVPEAGSSLLFPRLVGHQRASALLLLGEPLDAQTAHEWGFVNQVVEDRELLPHARAVAARLAALPPEAVRQTKALIRDGKPDLPGRIAEELTLFRQRLRSPEAAEAFQAFVEKRKPDFSRFE